MFGFEKGVVRVPRQDITRDPREDEDWFLRLPPEVQERTREAWYAKRVQHVPWHGRRRQMCRRCLVEGVVVMVGSSVLVGIGSWPMLLFALLTGMAVGWSWWVLGTGRLLSGPVAMAGMLVLVTASGFWSNPGDVGGFFSSAFAMFVAGLLGAALGLRRELDSREQAI